LKKGLKNNMTQSNLNNVPQDFWKLPEIDRSESPLIIEEETKFYSKWIKNESFQKYAFLLISIVVIILIALRLTQKNNAPEFQAPVLEIVVSPISIVKGSEIPLSLLQIIGISTKDLSKTQRLKILKSSQIKNINQKLFANHDIAPNQAIFWSDIKLQLPVSSSSTPNIKILYKGE
jgi:hypothetical protein